MTTIGLSISICRNKKRWTQERLASELGIGQSVLSQIENDQVSPKWSMILDIARLLQTDVMELLPLPDVALKDREWKALLLRTQDELLRAKDELIRVLQQQENNRPRQQSGA